MSFVLTNIPMVYPLFRDVFMKGLVEVLDTQPGSSAIIVPSVRDILSDHAVFPQCELDVSQPVDSVRSKYSYRVHAAFAD